MRSARALAAVPMATLLLAIAACGGTDRASGIAGDGYAPSPAQEGPCTPGQQRACSIELARTGSVVDCAKGEQLCQPDRTWTTCVANGTTFKAIAPPPGKGSPAPDLHTNSVGGSASSCTDNPCNPYCKRFDDTPDAGLTASPTSDGTAGPPVTLETSNVPPGFQKKGTLDRQCGDLPTSQSYLEACQFDMRCGTKADGSKGCVPFAATASDGCTGLGGGIDITAPVVCAPPDTTVYRNLTVCNRGSVSLERDIQCMSFPGNRPQFPDANPGAGIIVLNTGTTIDPITGTTNPITSSNPIRGGECSTYRVPSSAFRSRGTESIICNPPATGVKTTTTIDTEPMTAETVDFVDKDFALVSTDFRASATTQFLYEAVSPASFAAGTTNNVGFDTVEAITGAPDGNGAASALSTTVSTPDAIPSSVTNFADLWTPSSGSTLAGDLAAAADGKSTTRTMTRNDISSVLATGFSVPGLTGSLSGLSLTVETDTSDPVNASNWVWIQRASDGAWLYSGVVAPGTTTLDVALPYGALSAADLSTLRIYLGAVTTSYSLWTLDPVVRLGYLGLRAKQFAPRYASVDATGFTWASPPADPLRGLEVSGTWRSSATGAVIYAFVKKTDGTTVASTVFRLPAGYTAGSWTTSIQNVAVTGLTAADLAAGLKVTLQAYPLGGGTVDVDAIGVRPIVLRGSATRTIRLRDFGLAVPAGATNVRLTAYGTYRIDPLLWGDWISGAALSISGSTTTLIGTSSSTITNNSFNTYQLGAQTIADPTTIEDPKLVVDFTVGKGSGLALGTSVGSLDSVAARLQWDGIVGASVAECNPYNNWTVDKADPPTPCTPGPVTYPEWTFSRVFDGVCPVGARPRWRYMGYTSTTPAGTRIEFRFRTFARDATGACPTLPAVTSDPPAPLAIAQASPDTQVCSLTAATAACPVDLANGLGPVDSLADCLQMDAHGVPATTPPASPTLTDWRLTYDCIPSE